MEIIAEIKNNYTSKFGIPRQSGIIDEMPSCIIFRPKYRNPDYIRGLEGFSHIWLIWGFSQNNKNNSSPLVRPPKLGGNEKKGVFATRSPYRPNPIGLSCVKIKKITKTSAFGTVIEVYGADLMDGTPIYDIKPYLPYTDCKTDANGGFTDRIQYKTLDIKDTDNNLDIMPYDIKKQLIKILSEDPKPAYKNNPKKVYSFEYADYNIKFTADAENIYIKNVVKYK